VCIALLAAVCALMVASMVNADRVERRGTADAIDGTLLRAGPEGVTLRVSRNGLDREETVPWSEVRKVQGGAAVVGLDSWLDAGEALWRGRSRVRRNDWLLAMEPLERAAAAWRGTAPSSDGAAAALALTQAYVQSGRLADAMPVAFEAMRQLRAGMPMPEWAQSSANLVDAPRCLPASVPPMALPAADAARAAVALRAFDAHGDAALAHAALLVVAVLEHSAERPASAPRATESDRQGFAFLDALRDSASSNAVTRASGRRALAGLRRAVSAWGDPWVRFAVGASLAQEADATSRERGAVLLLSVDAVDRAGHPALASAARTRAAEAVAALGDTAGAERIRKSGPDTLPVVRPPGASNSSNSQPPETHRP
jgi:hypothetical protein